jgi:hypothetical protein
MQPCPARGVPAILLGELATKPLAHKTRHDVARAARMAPGAIRITASLPTLFVVGIPDAPAAKLHSASWPD